MRCFIKSWWSPEKQADKNVYKQELRTCSKSSGIHRKRPPLQGEARSGGLEQLVRRARKLGRGRTMPITR